MSLREQKNLIVFMSDFGVDSVYPGIVRGVIRVINRDAVVVDLTRAVPPFHVLLGALYLRLSEKWFPAGTIEGTVLFVDSFGNIVTSIASSTVENFAGAARDVMVNGVAGNVARTFGEVPRGMPGIVPGSFDRMEICLDREDAASFLGLGRGERVMIVRQ